MHFNIGVSQRLRLAAAYAAALHSTCEHAVNKRAFHDSTSSFAI